MEFLALQNIIEVSSMVFAADFVEEAQLKSTVGALVAVGETETRHEVTSHSPIPISVLMTSFS